MRKNIIILSGILIVWISGVSYWYVCEIRDNCCDKQTEEKLTFQIEEPVEKVDSVYKQEVSVEVDSVQVLKDYLTEKGTYQVFFNYSSHELSFSDEEIIHFQKLKKYIELVPNGKIIVNGYTDSKGTTAYNLELSRRRAEYVQNKLIELGIPSDRILVSAKGEVNTKIKKESRRTDILIK